VTTNYGPCGKCGQPTPMPMFYVPPVTWLGAPCCPRCTVELQGVGNPSGPARSLSDAPDGGQRETQQERFGK